MIDTTYLKQVIKHFSKIMLEATDYALYNATAIFYLFLHPPW
ncbi:inosine-5-monophosphate dehydrogenase [Pectobacterium parmentieri]|uniref:Inosine-5-monophosphate dehydrogenase n=2 Tax=Pectobacterium TaxID=122277 RepID=A0A8B3F5W9_PECPM|nr:inosine-5-monophosphate dehydrogenase [Pectobacterium parmentieri]KAA3666404.1 inosine-5-monophosphate dehydrogenase [Pectobacterium carotovorum subsp. carotovorum]MCL6373743.1 inosine-5-monophosphate dehydrogenase [Pectobacterium atrosepticum]MCL6379631.1 inosine-5-monophosphate dehydrogenase [Pectobacterium brasiliense]PLY35703.1 inosine-5-monophosphate dehydrogenase [Pectobacterium carotovorum]PWD72821.1 inosine-5-monophosphate dehydrogenase [Pectobacterium versatile]QHP81304.1 inosine-